MSRGQVHVGVQSSGQVPQQGNGWLGAALFGALDLIGGHASPPGWFINTQAGSQTLVVDGLAEG